MDPVTALIFAAIATHYIMKAAAQAGLTQARTEAGRAREAIRADLGARRDAVSQRLRERLDAGQRTGPRSVWWWLRAALRARSALRNVARQARRPAETRPGQEAEETGPIGRILSAMWRGAAYAWADVRRQRAENRRERPSALPDVGVCERCGAVVARAALSEGTTRFGSTAVMCALCQLRCEEERQADAAADAARRTPAEPADVAEGAYKDDGGQAADNSAAPPTPAPGAEESWLDRSEREEDDMQARRENLRNLYDPDPDGEIAALRAAQEEIRRRAAELRAAPGWDGRCGTPSNVACARCGSVVAAFSCTNPTCPLSWRNIPIPDEGWPEAVPERFALPVRMCPECSTQLLPNTWHAVNATNADVCLFCARDHHPEGTTREREPAELAAIGNPVGADGYPIPLHNGQHRMLGQEAARIATRAAAGPHAPCSLCGCPLDSTRCCNCCDGPPESRRCITETSRCGAADCDDGALPDGSTCPRCGGFGELELCLTHERPVQRCRAPHDSPPDSPAGPQASEPAPATTEGENNVSCDVHTQAAWQEAANAAHEAVGGIADSVENMLRGLSAKNAGRGHIAAAKGWGDQVAAVLARGRSIVADVNDHQDPYVDAVQGAGGSEEVADPDFYDEM
jgi:hypothetical protein